MPDIIFRFTGDPAGAERAARAVREALGGVDKATKATSTTTKQSARTAETAAQEKVAAAVRERRAVEANVRALREVAAAAQKGSREQVTAARLAAAEQRKLSSATSTTAREERELSRQAAAAERSLGPGTRGAAAGTGIFRSMGRSLAFASAGFLGAAGFVTGIRASVDAASNLNEQTNKIDVVLGKSAKTIVAWSKTTANAYGLASDQALEFAGTYAAFLRPFGVTQAKAAEVSKTLTQLGADLASFYNTDVAQSLAAIQSGLVGQVRPLRAYGVSLSEARVEAEAFASGLAKPTVSLTKIKDAELAVAIAQAKLTKAQREYGPGTTQVAAATIALDAAHGKLKKSLEGNKTALTDEQKVLARYEIIMKDTALAQGDFARTSDGHANTMRRLHAVIRDLEANVGQALIPSLDRAAEVTNKWLAKSENQRKVTNAVKSAVHALTVIVQTATPVVEAAWHAADHVAGAVGGWKNAIELLLALKVASTIAKWTGAIAGPGGLLPNLRLLAKTRIAIPITIAVGAVFAYPFLKKLFTEGFGADYSGLTPKGGQFNLPKGTPIKDGYGKIVGYADGKGGVDYTAGHESESPQTGGTGGPVAPGIAQGPGGSYMPISTPTRPTTDTHGARLKTAFGSFRGPNVDFQAKRGTLVGSPEDGVIDHTSGQASPGVANTGGAYGYSVYLVGDSGSIYFMTHFAQLMVRGGQRVTKGQPLGTVAAHISEDHIHIEVAAAGYVLPSGRGAGATTPSSSAAGAAAGTGLTVGSKSTKSKVPPLVAVKFTDAVTEAKTAVARASGTAGKVSALHAEIVALLSLQDALEAAEKDASPKRKAQIRKALLGVAHDLASARGDLGKIAAKASKEIAAGRAHQSLVDTYAHLLGVDDPSAMATRAKEAIEAPFAKLSDATLRKLIKAARAALAKIKADLAAEAKTAAPLAGLADGLKIEIRDKFGRLVDTTTMGAVKANLDRLFKAAQAAIAQAGRTNTPKARAAAAAAVKAYTDAVSTAFDEGAAALQAQQSAFSSAFQRVMDRILTAFDRETQSHIAEMQAQTSDTIDALTADNDRALAKLQADADRQIARLQRRLQSQIARLEQQRAKLTPAEAELASLQASHDAQRAAQDLADAQKALSEAQAGGDPAAIAQAQRQLDEIVYQQRIDGLQRQADAERAAIDKSIQAQEDALTAKEANEEKAINDHLAAQQQALQDELAAKIKTLNKEEAAREAEYQDERDAQRRTLEDELAAQEQALLDGTETWDDFLKWLQGKQQSGIFGKNLPDPVAAARTAGKLQGGAFADAFIAELQRAADAQAALTGTSAPNLGGGGGGGGGGTSTHDSRGIGGRFASGGIVGGVDTGRDSRTVRVRPGELILTRAQQERVAGELVGGRGVTVVIHNPTFLTGDRATARRFASRVQTETDKIIRANY